MRLLGGLFLFLLSLSGVLLKAEVTIESHSEWLLQKSARSYVSSPNSQYLERFGDHPNGGGLSGDLDQTLKSFRLLGAFPNMLDHGLAADQTQDFFRKTRGT